jgi:L-lysine exporter family protein LysE/ArgO
MLWSGFLLSLSLCLDLGLVNVAIVRTALRHGGAAAFAVGLGSCFGDLVYFVLSAVGVAALLTWAPVRWVMWLGGTAVLLVLAARMLRDVFRPPPLSLAAAGDAPPRSPARLFAWGVSLSIASPTAVLWFAAVGGSVIASSGGTRGQLALFAAGFFAAGIIWSAFVAAGSSLLRRVSGARLVRVLSLVSSVVFLYFAALVFWRGWNERR